MSQSPGARSPRLALQNGVVRQWGPSDGIMRAEWDGKCKALGIVAGCIERAQ